jgi:hypothetical protein
LGHALILCLFTHDQQIEAVKAVVRHEQGFHYFDNPVDLKQYMNRNVLLNLSTAIFDTCDPKLDKKAGACTACAKQTGANQQLFACITDEAKCLDKACFFRKTGLTININNKRLLKQFSKKPSDCALITDNYYSYEDEVLTRNHWRNVEQSDECPNVTLGIESDRDEHSIVRMVCLNKKCAVHFPKEESTRPTEVPENESKTDMVLRRIKKRRAKEKIKDHHAARNEYRKEIGNVQSEVINEWELGYVLNKLCWNAPGYLTELAQEAGFLKAKENLAWNNREKFVKYLQGKGLNFMFMFIRKLIALENLNPDDKYITEKSVEYNYLLQQGKSLDLDFKPILNKHLDARKESYAAENKTYKDLVKKEKEKAKRIDQLIKNAKQEYPFLHEVLQTKNRQDVLEKQSLETLSKMTFRLGLKRKKDADKAYYVETIIDGLSSLESDQKKN